MSSYKSIYSWLYALKRGNWKVIFLCIATATTFWFFRSLNGQYTTRINYPIHFAYDRDSLVAVEDLPQQLLIDVTSGGWNLLRNTYALNIIPLRIDLENPVATRYLAGASLFPMIADQISDLRLNYVVTDTVFFHLEQRISRKVKMEFDSSTFSFAENHRMISSLRVSIDTLEFRGPTSLIEALPDPFYVILPFAGIDESFDDAVQLLMDSTPLIQVSPEEIKLTFEVEEFITQFSEEPVRILNFPENGQLILRDSVVRVHYRLPESLSGTVPDSVFEVTTNFYNLNYSDSTIIPRITRYPEYVEELSLEPLQVKLVYGN